MEKNQRKSKGKLKKFIAITTLSSATLVGGMIFSDFPLVDKIIEKEEETDIVERKIGYEEFMKRASEILAKVDVTKKVDGYFSCTEQNIYELLFLYNMDFLTEDAIKRLMDEDIIKHSATENGESAQFASELVGIYEEKREFSSWKDGIFYEDLCLSDINLNLVKTLKEKTKGTKFLDEYYNFIKNDGVLAFMGEEDKEHLNTLPLSKYPIGLQYIVWSTYQFTNGQIQAYNLEEDECIREKLEGMNHKIYGRDQLSFLRESKYDKWFSLGITQYIDENFQKIKK